MNQHHSEKQLGAPSLKVAGFQLWIHGRQFPDAYDCDDGNWLHVTAHCGASGASIWVQGSIVMVTDIAGFGEECTSVMSGKATSAQLNPLEPELSVTLESTDRLGHICACVDITPNHFTQSHRIEFEIDQSYLPGIVAQCSEVVKQYPIRGKAEKKVHTMK
jgi:hypothetical protein